MNVAVSERKPKLLAVLGPHPELSAQLRYAAYAANERDADPEVFAHCMTGAAAKLSGTPDRVDVEKWAARQNIRISFFEGRNHLARMMAAPDRGPWSSVIIGPEKVWPWDAGLTRAEADKARAYARAGGRMEIAMPMAEVSTSQSWWSAPVWRLDQRRPWYHEYLLSAFAVSGSAMLAKWFDGIIPSASLSMVFLVAIIYSASAYGLGAALFSVACSIGVFNYFFLEPRFEFSPFAPDLILLTALFALVAALTSSLAGGLRMQADRAERQAVEARALLALTREIATAPDTAGIFAAIVRQCEEIFEAQCSLLTPYKTSAPLPDDSTRARSASLQVETTSDIKLSPEDIEAARAAFAERRPTGLGTSLHAGVKTRFQPLITSDGPVAVLGISGLRKDRIGGVGFERLIDAICRISSIAVERTLRAREVETSRVIAQTEGLRSALLSAIAHDFGTPLASIIGSASSLISYGGNYPPETQRDLLDTILEEAERLSRFVKNVLQMNKLESGALVPRMQWADVGDLIHTALDACHRRLHQHEVFLDVADKLPLAHVDFVLMESVLVNLLDNAAKYAPAETNIQITARVQGGNITIDVADQGRGIAAEELGAVFDKFYRAKKHRDRTVPGTGLGLAICKGIVEAHGGTIEALSEGLGHGTVFRIKLPLRAPEAAEVAEI